MALPAKPKKAAKPKPTKSKAAKPKEAVAKPKETAAASKTEAQVEQLGAESGVGNAAIIFRDRNESSVHRPSKALQQVLRDLGVEGGVDLGTVEAAKDRVCIG